jgi:hypothetical protein
LVITYFMLVRTVDFEKDRASARIDPASTVASLVFLIFLLYLLWDIVTKVIIYLKKPDGHWLRLHGSRMIPTIVCLILARIIWRSVASADFPHRLSADFALLWLVLLFRALKDLISAFFPRQTVSSSLLHRTKVSLVWTLVCACGITVGTLATKCSWPLPLPARVMDEINAPLLGETKVLETPSGLPSSELRSPDSTTQKPSPANENQ